MQTALDKLLAYPHEAEIVIVGKTDQTDANQKLLEIERSYKIHWDKNSELFNYETNMGKPSLLILKRNYRIIPLEEDKWNDIHLHIT